MVVCYGIADGVRVQFDADDFSGIAGCDEADGSDSAVGVHDAFVSGETGQGDGFFVQVFRLNRVDLVEGLRGDAEGAAAEFILDVTASEEDNVTFFPSTMLSVRSLTFSTIVVISGWSLRRAFTKLFFDGKTGDTQTRTTMISPEAKPVRTMTWRRRP